MREKDEAALKHVTSITFEKDSETGNYSITFTFSPNEFFEN